ncbi:hypothetical protein [Azotobacter armeniacus]
MGRRRLLGWLAFFACTGLLALLPEFFSQKVEPLVASRGGPGGPGGAAMVPAGQSAAQADARTLRAGPASQAVPQANLFAAHSWRAAPAPKHRPDAAALAAATSRLPSPPVAPPLPFQFIGRLDDSVRLRVFLLRGDRVHTVEAGDVIDGTYRLEKIAADELTLVYLPLNQIQSLSVGSNP